jgi:hypothetical protein
MTEIRVVDYEPVDLNMKQKLVEDLYWSEIEQRYDMKNCVRMRAIRNNSELL